MDIEACNFDSTATDESGACAYPDPGYNCIPECIVDTDGDGVCDMFEVVGCTDPGACNFLAIATEENGSCIFPDFAYNCDGVCLVDTDGDGICDPLEILG